MFCLEVKVILELIRFMCCSDPLKGLLRANSPSLPQWWRKRKRSRLVLAKQPHQGGEGNSPDEPSFSPRERQSHVLHDQGEAQHVSGATPTTQQRVPPGSGESSSLFQVSRELSRHSTPQPPSHRSGHQLSESGYGKSMVYPVVICLLV